MRASSLVIGLLASASAFRDMRGMRSSHRIPRGSHMLQGEVRHSAAARAAARVAAREREREPDASRLASQLATRDTAARNRLRVQHDRSEREPDASRLASQLATRDTAARNRLRVQHERYLILHDESAIITALSDFVRSNYAMQLFRYCNADPTDWGQISGMFEAIRLMDGKMNVKLTAPFSQKSSQLLDRLAEHLRTNVPHIVKRLEYSINGGWGQTRTWVLQPDGSSGRVT